jgi:uncharacterized membrane protein
MATQWETHPGARTMGPLPVVGRSTLTANGKTNRQANTATTDLLINSLGWFSIGLGLAEVLAPRKVAKITGARKHTGLIRAFGVREIISGVGILTNRRAAGWVWSRVGGDMLDLASLGAAMTRSGRNRSKTLLSAAAVAGVTVLDIRAAQQVSAQKEEHDALDRLEASVIVNQSPEECYTFWRHLENLPRFMSYLESVRDMGNGRSHWVALAPGNLKLEWGAEITEDKPGQTIAWRSLQGSEVTTTGSVEFQKAAGNRGTIVRVQMSFAARGQALARLAKLAGKHPEQMVYKDLRRFKQVMETGEVITTEGQPAGRTSGATWLDSIAR